jgi:hypothetical protein
MRALRLFVGSLVLGMVAVVTPASSVGSPEAAERDFYLALGDSLAAGHQPGRGDTANGYVNDVWEDFAQQIQGLGLRNVACSGETSHSLITGKRSPCRYAAGSQLKAALGFIAKHPGHIAFITVDVGPNDIFEHCLQETGLLERSCVISVMPAVRTRLSHIFRALSTAAGSSVPIVSMTYFDPLLGFWEMVPHGRALARASLRSFRAANARFRKEYQDEGVGFARVARTFRIQDFSHKVVVPGRGSLPLNVALTCRWTWFCSTRAFGDPHPNRVGYRKIANAFTKQLGALVP